MELQHAHKVRPRQVHRNEIWTKYRRIRDSVSRPRSRLDGMRSEERKKRLKTDHHDPWSEWRQRSRCDSCMTTKAKCQVNQVTSNPPLTTWMHAGCMSVHACHEQAHPRAHAARDAGWRQHDTADTKTWTRLRANFSSQEVYNIQGY